MNKKILAKKISEECGWTISKANILIDKIVDLIKKSLIKGEKVEIRNFGSFKVIKVEKKLIRDVREKKIKELPAKKKVKFKPFIKL